MRPERPPGISGRQGPEPARHLYPAPPDPRRHRPNGRAPRPGAGRDTGASDRENRDCSPGRPASVRQRPRSRRSAPEARNQASQKAGSRHAAAGHLRPVPTNRGGPGRTPGRNNRAPERTPAPARTEAQTEAAARPPGRGPRGGSLRTARHNQAPKKTPAPATARTESAPRKGQQACDTARGRAEALRSRGTRPHGPRELVRRPQDTCALSRQTGRRPAERPAAATGRRSGRPRRRGQKHRPRPRQGRRAGDPAEAHSEPHRAGRIRPGGPRDLSPLRDREPATAAAAARRARHAHKRAEELRHGRGDRAEALQAACHRGRPGYGSRAPRGGAGRRPPAPYRIPEPCGRAMSARRGTARTTS